MNISEQILAFALIVDENRICFIDASTDISFAYKNSSILNKNSTHLNMLKSNLLSILIKNIRFIKQ